MNSDIKRLYSHLGLSPRDYLELHPAVPAGKDGQLPKPEGSVGIEPIAATVSTTASLPTNAAAPMPEGLASLFNAVREPMDRTPEEEADELPEAELVSAVVEPTLERVATPEVDLGTAASLFSDAHLPSAEPEIEKIHPQALPGHQGFPYSPESGHPVTADKAPLQNLFKRLASKGA